MKRILCILLSLVLLVFCLTGCSAAPSSAAVLSGKKPEEIKAALSDGEQFTLAQAPWDMLPVNYVKNPKVPFGVEPKQIYTNSTDTLDSTTMIYPCRFAGRDGTVSLFFIDGALRNIRFDFDDEDQQALWDALLPVLEDAFGEGELMESIQADNSEGGGENLPLGYKWVQGTTELRLTCDMLALSSGSREDVCIILADSLS